MNLPCSHFYSPHLCMIKGSVSFFYTTLSISFVRIRGGCRTGNEEGLGTSRVPSLLIVIKAIIEEN
jgi:hypothetical protein